MNVCKKSTDSSVNVEYCLDHSGHSPDLGHLSISEDMRTNVAGKLSQGIEPANAKILDIIIKDISEIDRDSLITKKDMNNIKIQFNISESYKHKEDRLSVDIWVKQLAEKDNNPILLYNPQNSKDETLDDKDFLLCIQTKFQREMMLQYGGHIILADSPHYTI